MKSVENDAESEESQFSSENGKQRLDQVQSNLTELIKLTNVVNTLWKELCFWFILNMGMFASKDFDKLMISGDFVQKITCILCLHYTHVGMILSV